MQNWTRFSSCFNRSCRSCNVHPGQNQEEDKGGRSPRIPLTQDANCSTPSPTAGTTEPCTQKHPYVRKASSAAAVTPIHCSPMSTVYWRPIHPPESLNCCCCDAIVYFHCLIYFNIIQKDADSRNRLCWSAHTCPDPPVY